MKYDYEISDNRYKIQKCEPTITNHGPSEETENVFPDRLVSLLAIMASSKNL